MFTPKNLVNVLALLPICLQPWMVGSVSCTVDKVLQPYLYGIWVINTFGMFVEKV